MTPSHSEGQSFDVDRFRSLLQTERLGRHVRYTYSTGSTNQDALRLASTDVPDGALVLADAQTAGRGRRGRSWHSPPLGNLYGTILLLDQPGTQSWVMWLSWLPLVSALAVAEAIGVVTGLQVSLKWPNDLMIDNKKLGGLLCESTGGRERPVAVALGLGLNVNADPATFPSELRDTATSLCRETGKTIDRPFLLAGILERLEKRLHELRMQPLDTIRSAYVGRCATLHREVRVELSEGQQVTGLAESIGIDGCLQLRVHGTGQGDEGRPLLDVRSADVTYVRG